MENPTGESVDGPLRLDFDRRLTLQFRGSVVTSDAGLLAYRELDDALGLSVMAGGTLADARTGRNGRHALVGLLRQSVFGRLAGYERCQRCRTPAPRSCHALDRRRRVSRARHAVRWGAETRWLRRNGTRRARRTFRADRPCAWSSPAERHRSRHDLASAPLTASRKERLERPLRLHLLSSCSCSTSLRPGTPGRCARATCILPTAGTCWSRW